MFGFSVRPLGDPSKETFQFLIQTRLRGSDEGSEVLSEELSCTLTDDGIFGDLPKNHGIRWTSCPPGG